MRYINLLFTYLFTYFQCATIAMLTVRVYLYSFSRCSSQTCQLAQNSEKIWTYSSSRSIKVDYFCTNRKRICEFLLVIGDWSYLALFLRYGDFLGENCVSFIPLSYSAPPLPVFPLEFHREVKRQETTVIGLLYTTSVVNRCWSGFPCKWRYINDATFNLYGEGCVILTSTVFEWSTRVTDRQTDGRTGDCI